MNIVEGLLQGRLNGRDLYKMQKPRPERSNFSHFTTWWRNFLLLFNCFPFQSWLRIQQNSALFPLFSLFSCLFKHWKYIWKYKAYTKKNRAEIPFCTLHHFSMKLPNLLLISFFSTSLWNNKKLQLPVFYKKCCHLENWTANKSRKILIFAVWLSTVSDV